jgi:hypothetical protein
MGSFMERGIVVKNRTSAQERSRVTVRKYAIVIFIITLKIKLYYMQRRVSLAALLFHSL